MPVDPNRVQSVFLTAIEQPTRAARAAYVAQACRGDEGLRRRVEALLAAHDTPAERPAQDVGGLPAGRAEPAPTPHDVPTDPSAAGHDALDTGALAGESRVLAAVKAYQAAHERGERPDRQAWLARHADVAGPLADALDALAFVVAAAERLPLPEPGAAEGPGSQVGPYRLVRLLGEGGMGTVWLADQRDPVQRQVALKVIKPGLDGGQLLARFEAERQALALMDHPNIAKVFDGGATPSRRPFLVMELVQGVPITRYAADHRLTVRERLELFIPVCQAVQHAHQKGIIHRDLKPSNVLVAVYDGQPVPKVIDFGVAKATGAQLTDRTLVTGVGAVVGTIEYMAPEQAEMDQPDVDTRADVYSLGVLLYELLTGTTPLDRDRVKGAPLLEVLRRIREEEPPRPSARLGTAPDLPQVAANRGVAPKRLAGLVRGELDWIVMKCLDKDRARRYETANGLALDLQRYLHDEPVQACPPSVGYRFRKFARRNKRALAGAALVGAVLSAAAVVLAVSNVQINQAYGVLATEKRNAERAYQKAAEAERGLGLALASERHALTIYGVSLADREWTAGRSDKAERALDDCPVANRHWAWHFLKRLCNQDLHRVQFPVSDSWTGAPGAFAPGGKLFAASADSTRAGCKVWDTRTGRAVAALAGSGRGAAVAFSPDGKRVVAPGGAGATFAAIWDVATGQQLAELAPPTRPGPKPAPGRAVGSSRPTIAPAFRPGGRSIAVIHSATAVLYDTDTGQVTRVLKPGGVSKISRLDFSPDGKHLALALQRADRTQPGAVLGEIRIVDADTGEDVRSLVGGHRVVRVADRERRISVDEDGEPAPAGDVIGALCYSPDGKYLASAGIDRTIRLWDPETGQPVRRLVGHDGPVTAVQFSPDGRRLASGGLDQTVRLWDAATGQEFATHRGHFRAVHGLGFHADGTRLVSASADGTLRTWAVAPSRSPLKLDAKVHYVFFSPTGDRLAATHSVTRRPDNQRVTEVRLWETNTLRQLWARDLPAFSLIRVRFAEEKCLALVPAGPNAHAVVDVEAQKEVHQLVAVGPTLSPDWRRTIVELKDAAGGFLLGEVRADFELRDTSSGRTLAALGKYDARARVAIHPDGRRLIVFSPRQAPRVLDDQGRELSVLNCPPGVVGVIAFSPDGERLAVASGLTNQPGELRQWDLRTGQEVGSFDGHPAGVATLCYSPDGRLLVSGGQDQTVKVWDTRTGRQFLALRGHTTILRQVAFSPDGRLLVSVGPDGTGLVWDGRPWEESPGRVIDLSGGFRGSRKRTAEGSAGAP